MNRSEDLIFRCFASGSSGNCYYLGTHTKGILIDAGISSRTIIRCLHEMHIAPSQIAGLLVTHDHADHIRSVGTLADRFHIPVYTTALIHEGMEQNHGLHKKISANKRYFKIGEPWQLAGLNINSFEVEHDATQCVGFFIDNGEQHFMLLTDCGSPNENIANFIRQANHIVIEANHDEDILLNGNYPIYLKERVLSDKGHQSNHTCGQLLSSNYHTGMRNIFLCHLSEENNDPKVALNTVANYFVGIGIQNGKDIHIQALERLNPSPIYILNNEIIHTI